MTALQSKSSLQDAIFEYLNLNRHKFDEHGNFDPTPDRRDYFPLAASVTGVPWFWKYIIQDKTPDEVSQDRNAAELQDWAKGVRYTKEQCLDEYEKDIELCDDGPGGQVRRACYDRAGNRLTNCYSTGSYNRQGRWTFQDATGQPQGDEDPDKRRKPQQTPPSNPERDPDEQAKRAALLREMSKYPWEPPYPLDNAQWWRNVLKGVVVPPSAHPEGIGLQTPYSPPPMLLPILQRLGI